MMKFIKINKINIDIILNRNQNFRIETMDPLGIDFTDICTYYQMQ